MTIEPKICAWCEQPFVPKQSMKKKYCSHACSTQASCFRANGRIQFGAEDLRPKKKTKNPFDRYYAERQKAQTIEMYARVII